MCFMIPFPLRAPALLFPQKAAARAAASAPRENGVLRRFELDFKTPAISRPAAFQCRITKPFFRVERAPALFHLFSQPMLCVTVPVSAFIFDAIQWIVFHPHPCLPLAAFPDGLLPSARWRMRSLHSSPRFDTPRPKCDRARKLPQLLIPAQMPPGPRLRHRADSRSPVSQPGKHCGCAAQHEAITCDRRERALHGDGVRSRRYLGAFDARLHPFIRQDSRLR